MTDFSEFNSEEQRSDAANTLRAAAAILDDGPHQSLADQLRTIADDMEMIGQ